MRATLAKWLIRCAYRMWPPEIITDIPIVPERELPAFLLSTHVLTAQRGSAYYAPTRFELEAAEAVARHEMSLVVVDHQACACVHRIGSC